MFSSTPLPDTHERISPEEVSDVVMISKSQQIRMNSKRMTQCPDPSSMFPLTRCRHQQTSKLTVPTVKSLFSRVSSYCTRLRLKYRGVLVNANKLHMKMRVAAAVCEVPSRRIFGHVEPMVSRHTSTRRVRCPRIASCYVI
jgi:hypothetical protein